MRTLFCVLLIGCTGTPPASQPDLAPPPDLNPAPHITAGATDGTVSLKNADFSVSGSGFATVGAFNLTHGSGTIELDGVSVPAAAYLKQDFGPYFLYQTLAVESSRLWVLWFYCDKLDNSVAGIYYEATDGTDVTFETGSGTCQDTGATSTVAVQFPAIDLTPPPLLAGFTIDGAQVKLDGAQPGTVTLGGVPLTVLAFNTVDCRKCTTPPAPGWMELHALLWDASRSQVCFGIFYLKLDDTTHVQLAWSLTLPTLTDPAGDIVLPATWTIP